MDILPPQRRVQRRKKQEADVMAAKLYVLYNTKLENI